MNDFIQAQSISFSYHVEEGQAPVNVFENLSVDIHQGEMTAVLGHNGPGKSTFAKHLNAILLPSGKSMAKRTQEDNRCLQAV